MTQLTFDFDVKQPSVAYHDKNDTLCRYCGREWGNITLYEINCHYEKYPSFNGMCGTEFWIARRAGKA